MATNNAINQMIPTGFFAYLSAPTANDKTGDNTPYTVLYDSTLFTDGNYNAADGKYTAPTSGSYLVSACIQANNISSPASLITLVITPSGGIAVTAERHGVLPLMSSDSLSCNISTVIKMTAGSTIYASIIITNTTKTVGVNGSASPFSSYFSAILIG